MRIPRSMAVFTIFTMQDVVRPEYERRLKCSIEYRSHIVPAQKECAPERGSISMGELVVFSRLSLLFRIPTSG